MIRRQPISEVIRKAWAALPGDRREDFEERAAIREFDGGLPRERAEREAIAEVVRG